MTWDNSAITITTFLPVLGALVIVLVPKDKDRLIRGLGIVVTGIALLLAIAIAMNFDYSSGAALQDTKYFLNLDWIPVDRRALHGGDRRDVDAALRPDVPALVPVRDLHVAVRPAARADEGVPRADAAARDRDGGHLHRVRPDPVLRVLGARPGPDVLPDRDLGVDEPRVRGDQVLPVHAVRVDLHAAGLPGHVLRRARPAHLQPAGADRLRAGGRVRPDVPADRVRRRGARAGREGPDVAAAHVAARRPHRGADDRLGPAGGRDAEDGHLRVHPDRDPDAARTRPASTPRGSGCWRRSRSSTRRWPASRSGT